VTCPICRSCLTPWKRITDRLALARCSDCGHTVAEHCGEKVSDDYHQQYDLGPFLASLEATRLRQADLIIDRLQGFGAFDRLLDFGAGRGWFLRRCRERGAEQLVGSDNSLLALKGLSEWGIPSIPAPSLEHMGEDLERWLASLPFPPRVVSFLDVIEHFPENRAQELITRITKSLIGRLEWVVIKVPVSEGFLYRLARKMRWAGICGPLEQLYQVGTHPPHFHYFSRRSLRRFISNCSLREVERIEDFDFEPESLGARVGALRRIPDSAASAAGRLLGKGIALTKAYDSQILLLRV
jgi:hypothetical protein